MWVEMSRGKGRYEVLKPNNFTVAGLFSYQKIGRDVLCLVCPVLVSSHNRDRKIKH